MIQLFFTSWQEYGQEPMKWLKNFIFLPQIILPRTKHMNWTIFYKQIRCWKHMESFVWFRWILPILLQIYFSVTVETRDWFWMYNRDKMPQNSLTNWYNVPWKYLVTQIIVVPPLAILPCCRYCWDKTVTVGTSFQISFKTEKIPYLRW